jgi:hypothetical protein
MLTLMMTRMRMIGVWTIVVRMILMQMIVMRMIVMRCARPMACVREPDAITWSDVVGIPSAIPAAIEVEHPVRLAGIEVRIGVQKRAQRHSVLSRDARERIAVPDGDRLLMLRPAILCSGRLQAVLEFIARRVIGGMISRLGAIDRLGPQQRQPPSRLRVARRVHGAVTTFASRSNDSQSSPHVVSLLNCGFATTV